MTHGKTRVVLAGALVLGAAALLLIAEASANPYQGIVERNLFALKDPPPPPAPEAVKPEAPKLFLTGITTIFGNKRALLKTAAPAPKPGQPPQGEQSLMLTEGQRDGEVEVIQIDEKAGSVKVRNGGQELTLTFEKDAPKIASAAPVAAPGAPGIPGAAPVGIPSPLSTPGGGYNPAAMPGFGSPAAGSRSIPTTRSLRLPPGAGGSYAPPMGAGAYMPGGVPTTAGTAAGVAQPGTAQAGQVSLPAGGLFGSPTQNKQPNWPPERFDVSREEQAALLLLQRETYKNSPNAPPFPPLPGDPTPNSTPMQDTTGQNSSGSGYVPRPGMPLPPGQMPPF